jgi:hypothetical protein
MNRKMGEGIQGRGRAINRPLTAGARREKLQTSKFKHQGIFKLQRPPRLCTLRARNLRRVNSRLNLEASLMLEV